MIINILVNYPIDSVFHGSADANNKSTNANKMYNLFEKTIAEIRPQIVVRFMNDHASEIVKIGGMMMVV